MMMMKSSILLSLLPAVALASRFPSIKHIVAFGDSYTDEGRLGYIFGHNATLPPKGYVPPVNNATSSGGYIWARLAATSSHTTLHDYAVSGAVCSNNLTPRFCSGCPDGLYPSVEEYEIPAFLEDFQVKPKHGSPYLKLDPKQTVYTIWIGTNDLGNSALLTDEHQPGVSLVDVTNCVINSVTKLYKEGARNFIVQNAAPLHLAPQYATPARHGVTVPNHYFPDKNTVLNNNLTAISEKMRELVLTTNQIWKYQLPAIAKTLHGAKIAHFDSFNLISNIINNPKQHISAPYNTTGYHSHCTFADNCATSYVYDAAHWDGYVWYDELHPSERTDRIIADEIVKTLSGSSKYATYYF